jgi:hypothetical protein
MPGRRPKRTGYGLQTLEKRLDAICDELLLMADDGRLTKREAHQIRAHTIAAAAITQRIRRRRSYADKT